ncbi:polysaccharide deacetylase family protein [Futiania mangrovi]|uniref:Chitooligosaccharide deacetylase n=1 Tax=Futiania mangrovi TaxID=2959716 RepID=A0A9J6PBZ8_9PROT|nr:polysaccharide deacetylase [Futiania mangrovii]MCP1335123.1 polysaccharide deacetylase [Futiania mangrovii]
MTLSNADVPEIVWPNGARCAVMLTFDFDAETLWLSRNPDNAKRPGILSQGLYGARVGVPKILELLREEQVPATFFVPGWTAERHQSRAEAILKDGHEIGHHGYLHEWIHPDYPDQEEEALDKGLDALQRTLGLRPKGYRSPAGETSGNMIRLLTERGFVYDTSLMDSINPYRHVLEDGSPGLIELPWHWSCDDAPFSMFSVQTPRTIVDSESILRIWQEEFHEIYRWGGLFDLVMHPQFIGRPNRLAMLRRFIQFLKTYDNVWFATGEQIASCAAEQM